MGFELAGNLMEYGTHLTRSIIESQVVFISLNRSTTGLSIANVEKQLQVAHVLDKQVYFIIEEDCDWKKPPFNAYTVLPTNLKPVKTQEGLLWLYKDLDAIFKNLSKYLRPADSKLEIEKYKSFIDKAKATNDLDLVDLGLKTIPQFVFSLSNLRVLDLSNNDIAEIPDEISNLTNLEILILNGNKKFQHIPEGVVKLPNLRILHLSGTSLYQFPESFSNLKMLRELHINDTPIQVFDPEMMINLQLTDLKYDLNILNLPDSGRLKKDFSNYKNASQQVKKYFQSIATKYNDYLSVIEIHSELAKPHYAGLFRNLKKKVRYTFFQNVHKPADLFRIINANSSSENTLVYLCDEKNILAPAFREKGNESMVMGQFFGALQKPLNLLINNPDFNVESLKELAESGDLNFVALRKRHNGTKENFVTGLFERLVKTEPAQVLLDVYVSIIQRDFSETKRVIDSLLKRMGPGAVVFHVSEYPLKRDLGDIQKCDVFLLIIEDDQNIPSGDRNEPGEKAGIEEEYEEAIRLGKPVIPFINKTNRRRFNTNTVNFINRLSTAHTIGEYEDSIMLDFEISASLASFLDIKNKEDNSLRQVLTRINKASTENVYDIFYNENIFRNFSLAEDSIPVKKVAKSIPIATATVPLSWLGIDVYENHVGIINSRGEVHVISQSGEIKRTKLEGVTGKRIALIGALDLKQGNAYITGRRKYKLHKYKFNVGPGISESIDLPTYFPLTQICAGSKKLAYIFGELGGTEINNIKMEQKATIHRLSRIVMADTNYNGGVMFSDKKSVEIWKQKKSYIVTNPFNMGIQAVCFTDNGNVVIASSEAHSTIKIFNPEKPSKTEILIKTKSKITAVTSCKDLILAGTNSGAELYSLKGYLIEKYMHPEKEVLGVFFNNTANLFVVAGKKLISLFEKGKSDSQWRYDVELSKLIAVNEKNYPVNLSPKFLAKKIPAKKKPIVTTPQKSKVAKKPIKISSVKKKAMKSHSKATKKK